MNDWLKEYEKMTFEECAEILKLVDQYKAYCKENDLLVSEVGLVAAIWKHGELTGRAE